MKTIFWIMVFYDLSLMNKDWELNELNEYVK